MQAIPAAPPLKAAQQSGQTPGLPLSPTPRKRRWRTIPWKARNGPQRFAEGTILFAGPETGAISIDPHLEGPHQIFIGLPTSLEYANPNAIRIKLDNDPCYAPLALAMAPPGTEFRIAASAP
jgi:hypothetical protein